MKREFPLYVEIGPIPEPDDRDWAWFRTFVKQIRALNNALMYQTGNNLQVSINLVDHDISDWRTINPFNINLRGGVMKYVHPRLDVKRLFLMKRSGLTEEYDISADAANTIIDLYTDIMDQLKKSRGRRRR